MKIFWSYAKRDDANPQHVTQLRKQFEIVLGQCIGDDIDLFQDTTGLKWGVNWRSALESEVKSSNVFVCILSPSYFNSKMCIQEVVWATEAGISIHPILYRACPKGLKSDFSESDSEAAKLNGISENITSLHQYVDFTSLRNEPKDSCDVLNFLDKVCEQIA
ncbi:toll/interleukin-1 receptor domain-containing protein [Photobacterium alginatilyticum]|uniref:Toll/interleukin-1 receptor domain-containing protein n=1 Tax=Photobacterium alginatilyticum TaxID=1775171 RepID=A0ABW9YQN6_9GAMM|nr:toll/interleukin-1 receptor domain-containing protein [Photobacterium alginatilyticum]NBI56262.1 toll/interleukin-1 receptor domain-containing protein [Photobacterium alginatilyticum]